MDRLSREKLKWKCRRGLLELDLILQRYLGNRLETLGEHELAQLNRLLDLPDNDLWDIVSGRSNDFDERDRDLVMQLRVA